MTLLTQARPVPLFSSVGMVVASMVLFQLSAGLARPLVAEIGAAGVAWLRMGAAGAVLFLITRPRLQHLDRRSVLPALAMGGALAVMSSAFLAAVSLLPLGLAATITFLGPLGVAICSGRGWWPFALSVLAGVGVMLALDPWSSGTGPGWTADPVGLGFAVLAACGFGGYILMSRRVGQMFGGMDGLAISLVTATLLLTPVGVLSLNGIPSPTILLACVGLAIMSPLMTCWLEMTALRTLGAAVFSILLSLEPAIAAVLGIVLLLELPNAVQMLGIACVVIASVAVVRTQAAAH